jgi:hypothetical protein
MCTAEKKKGMDRRHGYGSADFGLPSEHARREAKQSKKRSHINKNRVFCARPDMQSDERGCGS